MSSASPRDVIARAIVEYRFGEDIARLEDEDFGAADTALAALTAAGYRVVREGELDAAPAPDDLIAEAISEAFGERCPEVVQGCPCCDAWAQYDALKTPELAWKNAALAWHWIQRYADGIDPEPQLDRILDCVEVRRPIPTGGR